MLNIMQIKRSVRRTSRRSLSFCRKSEQGVVLLIALIVLVAMTLAGVALVRSTYTTNLIAGNLAFSQAATQAGDIGTEKALTFLRSGVSLYNNPGVVATGGYSPIFFDPAPGASWQAFWQQLEKGIDKDAQERIIAPKPVLVPLPEAPVGGDPTEYEKFEKNYRISYVIHRLCDNDGAPNQPPVTCAQPPKTKMDGVSNTVNGGAAVLPQVYYRITVRVLGPRSTESFIQTIVAI